MYIYDTPEQIQMCLSCSKPECTNCLGNTDAVLVSKTWMARQVKIRRVRELSKLGLSDRKIAAHLGMDYRTVARMREDT